MGIEFDKVLCALASCPVLECENGGHMTYNPHPVICADSNEVLAHEICHVLAGRKDFAIFYTAVKSRKCEEFKTILNILYDWYHEKLYRNTSGYLDLWITRLRDTNKAELTGIKDIDKLIKLYEEGILPDDMPEIESVIDLIVYADKLYNNLNTEQLKILTKYRDGKKLGTKAGSDIGTFPKKSDYYIKQVSKYYDIISTLSNLWKKNKYEWINNYYGEINWKNLLGTYIGEKISAPVFRLFQKIRLSRNIYLVIDRSGSTAGINNLIMDTAIIITESFRLNKTPISILDVGVTNSIVNKIDQSLDLEWFTPTSDGGTPLGDVCNLIKDADNNSYLIIITDGQPDSWDKLVSSLNAFPGQHITFVIGDSFEDYKAKIKNAISVEPNTIIREMQHENSLC